MGVVLAPAIGPILGGWLTDRYGWPWIFYINLPVSIAGILMVASFVHDPRYLRRGVKKIDWTGIALVARGEQIHRVQMVSQVTAFNPNLAALQHQAAGLLDPTGLNPTALSHSGQALLNVLVNRQATMMAYNDVSWILGLLFLFTIPFALMLPSRRSIARQQKRQGDG